MREIRDYLVECPVHGKYRGKGQEGIAAECPAPGCRKKVKVLTATAVPFTLQEELVRLCKAVAQYATSPGAVDNELHEAMKGLSRVALVMRNSHNRAIRQLNQALENADVREELLKNAPVTIIPPKKGRGGPGSGRAPAKSISETLRERLEKGDPETAAVLLKLLKED